jgi:hypothetical protein
MFVVILPYRSIAASSRIAGMVAAGNSAAMVDAWI